MTIGRDTAVLARSTAMAEAAAMAGYAPSIHNTQPWKWRVNGDTLELHAQFGRQLPTSDPNGRLMAVSCGAALHHVRVALAAAGWAVDTDRLPDATDGDLLARLTLTGRTEVTPQATALFQSIQSRHTDRRPVTDEAVGKATIDAIRSAVEAEGASLHILRADDVLDLASAADRAQTLETFDPRWREEIAFWAGAAHPEGLGVPEATIPDHATQTTVPGRDFGRSGDLPVSAGHDRAAVYGILFGNEDTLAGWLRGGEGLSAGWLTATEAGVSLLPLSAAVEVETTRQVLRRLLSHLGEPYLVVRLGIAEAGHGGPPHTPRLPSTQTVEVVGQPEPSGS